MFDLKLKSLKFISLVDRPAQETATVRLLKRDDGTIGVSGTAPILKLDDELGVAFLWAVTDKAAGSDYIDLQGDHVVADDNMVKAALEYALAGAPTDEQHNRVASGSVPFLMPMTPEIAKAFGVTTDTTGLMVGIKPPADVFAKLRSGELTGVSIDGIGERTPIDKGRGKAKADDDELSDADRAALDEEEKKRKEKERKERERAERELKKLSDEAAQLRIVVALPEAQREHWKGLGPEAQTAFLAMGHEAREREVEKVAEAAQAEVRKRAEQETADAEVQKVLNTRAQAEQTLDRVAKRWAEKHNVDLNRARGMALMQRDPEAVKAYNDIQLTKRDEVFARAQAIAKRNPDYEDPDTLEAELDKRVEAFAVAHNLDQLQARMRLLEISTEAKDLQKRWHTARNAVHHAYSAAENEVVEVQRAAAQKAADEKRAAEQAAIEARRTPTEKALHARVEEVAKSKGITIARVWAHLSDDPMLASLYNAWQIERAGRAS